MTRDEVALVQGADARSRLEEVMAEVPADGVVEVTAGPGEGAVPSLGLDGGSAGAWGVVGFGVESLRAVLRTSAQALRPVARIRVPMADGRLLAALHREAEVLGQEQRDGVVVTARVEARSLGQLRREGVSVEIEP